MSRRRDGRAERDGRDGDVGQGDGRGEVRDLADRAGGCQREVGRAPTRLGHHQGRNGRRWKCGRVNIFFLLSPQQNFLFSNALSLL